MKNIQINITLNMIGGIRANICHEFSNIRSSAIAFKQCKLINYYKYKHSNLANGNCDNVIDIDALENFNNIISCFTIKIIKHNINLNKCQIVVDQVKKYCTFCDLEKNNSEFTNKTHKQLLEMSNFTDYIFTLCDTCQPYLKSGVYWLYLKFILRIKSITDVEAQKNSLLLKEYIKTKKHENLLFYYFILTR